MILNENTLNEALKLAIEAKKQTGFVPEYHSRVKDTEALGCLISGFFEWDGYQIIETFLEALEDANFHTLHDQIEQLCNNELQKFGMEVK
jgi:hypothetical protein